MKAERAVLPVRVKADRFRAPLRHHAMLGIGAVSVKDRLTRKRVRYGFPRFPHAPRLPWVSGRRVPSPPSPLHSSRGRDSADAFHGMRDATRRRIASIPA